MITALFTRKNSIYKELGIDSYDSERNALTFPGGNSVIAHPPCRGWGQLSHFANPLPGEKDMAIWAVKQIQKFGGILEHPKASRLWAACNLPKGKQIDVYGGYSLCIDQSWFGHKVRKSTLLYIVGCPQSELPEIPLSFDAITHFMGKHNYKRCKAAGMKELSKPDREHTPVALAKWLIEVAEKCDKNINQISISI